MHGLRQKLFLPCKNECRRLWLNLDDHQARGILSNKNSDTSFNPFCNTSVGLAYPIRTYPSMPIAEPGVNITPVSSSNSMQKSREDISRSYFNNVVVPEDGQRTSRGHISIMSSFPKMDAPNRSTARYRPRSPKFQDSCE